MDALKDDLEQVTADLATAEAELVRIGARVEGLRAQRDALLKAVGASVQSGDESDEDIASMYKADAIVAVLRAAKPKPLRAAGIVEALHRAGRTNEVAQNVSVYLDGLLKQGRVIRVSRGEYTVPD